MADSRCGGISVENRSRRHSIILGKGVFSGTQRKGKPMTNRAVFFLVITAIICIVVPQSTQAVSPAPDGGYAGNNTAEGTGALFSRTTGVNNTALGFDALYHDTSGSNNTAAGLQALFNNTTGAANTATGLQALFNNTTGIRNTADGTGALLHNNGSYNTATGWAGLVNNTSGSANTADGAQTLYKNTTGVHNTASGAGALLNSNGNDNTAMGWAASLNNTVANGNTAVGAEALRHATSGSLNAACGYQALFDNSTGVQNTAIGSFAGQTVTGSDNTMIGAATGGGVTTAGGVTCIGFGISGANVNDTTWIHGVYGKTTQSGTTLPVVVSNAGQLGTAASAERFKKDIKPMEETSEAILQLRPVTFHYKSDDAVVPQFGLVAEDVEKINPDLVVKDNEGKVFSVRYDAVNAMLLNEFLKEHRKVEKQEARLAQQQRQIEAVTAGLQKLAAEVKIKQNSGRGIVNGQ
jgi:hypothetical protein